MCLCTIRLLYTAIYLYYIDTSDINLSYLTIRT